MNSTKRKILDQSLVLFNHKGINQVSLRSISSELNISVGNLQYHFKKREDIVHELYFQLVEEMNIEFNKVIQSNNELLDFFKLSHIMVTCFYKYRFIFQDFNSIVNQYPKIKNHYSELIVFRKQQFSESIKVLVSNSFIRKEELPNEYDNLFTRIQILSDFWMSSALSQSKIITNQSILEYVDVINQTFYPYLTSKGIAVYKQFNNL